MQIFLIKNPSYYFRYLQKNPLEVKSLFQDLLVGVTCFFRDAEAFEKLQETVKAFEDVVLPEALSSNEVAATSQYGLDEKMAAIEQELQNKDEYLQTIIEELETSNEELQSTNEEFQSSIWFIVVFYPWLTTL